MTINLYAAQSLLAHCHAFFGKVAQHAMLNAGSIHEWIPLQEREKSIPCAIRLIRVFRVLLLYGFLTAFGMTAQLSC